MKDKPMTIDPLKRMFHLLDFMGTNLEHINNLRKEMQMDDKNPNTLLVPGGYLFGMKLQFYDGDTVKVAELQKGSECEG